jgi:nucleoside-diphosphate-sugar epimerase
VAEAVHVIGASGRSGSALCRALLAGHVGVVPIVRTAAKWATRGIALPARVADITDQHALAAVLADARRVVSCVHARHAPAVLAAAPREARFVFLGSTRKFTRWPDRHGRGVIEGETAWLASGRAGVMLHPTMIYGAQGEDNVQRLARLLRYLPVLPLPGNGRALVQPIYQADVTRAIRAALDIAWSRPEVLIIAGPWAVTYAEFLREVARAAGAASPHIIGVPAGPLIALAPLTRLMPVVPTVRPAEVRRLLEDKAFDIGPMKTRLGVDPISLAEGLALAFKQTGQYSAEGELNNIKMRGADDGIRHLS